MFTPVISSQGNRNLGLNKKKRKLRVQKKIMEGLKIFKIPNPYFL